jgi:hypothetical protein
LDALKAMMRICEENDQLLSENKKLRAQVEGRKTYQRNFMRKTRAAKKKG